MHIQHVLVQFRYACYKLTGNYIPETTGNRKRKNVIEHPPVFIFTTCASTDSLRTADAFPVVASLPPKNSELKIRRRRDSTTADLVEGAWGEVAVAMARKIALRKLARRRVVIAPFPVEV